MVGYNNAEEYINHEFVKYEDGRNKTVKLISYEINNKEVDVYSLVTSYYLNALANDLLTIDLIEIALVPFKINDDLKFDEETYINDIQNIGLMSKKILEGNDNCRFFTVQAIVTGSDFLFY